MVLQPRGSVVVFGGQVQFRLIGVLLMVMGNDVAQKADELTKLACTAVNNDLLWTFFGYKRRPRKGYFSSFFKVKSELNRIDFLSREFFIYLLAIELKEYPVETKQAIIEHIFVDYFLKPLKYDLSNAFGFQNKTD